MVNENDAQRNSVLNNHPKKINIIKKKDKTTKEKSVMKRRNMHSFILLVHTECKRTNQFAAGESDIYRLSKSGERVTYIAKDSIMAV